MNSSILVSGFVVIGVGAMLVLFNPLGSSDATTSSNPTSTYQVSAASKEVSTTSSVKVTSSDPEPFTWENKKEKTVASTGILNDLNNKKKSAAKKVAKSTTAKARKSPFGQRGLGSKTKEATPETQPVSKTSSSFAGKADSTVDADLDSFFGSSKPKTKPKTTEVSKAPQTKPAVTEFKPKTEFKPEVKPEPVRVASKPEPVRVASKPAVDSTTSWPTQEVKTTPKKSDDMFSFSPRGEDGFGDAPKLDPSKDFDMPTIEPVKEEKTVSKTELSSQDFSGAFESVLTKPEVSTPAVKEFNIENPLQTRLAVTFLANGKKVTLKPGQHYKITQSENVQVKFSRGGSFGFFEESLSEGDYEFSVTRKEGWKLAQ